MQYQYRLRGWVYNAISWTRLVAQKPQTYSLNVRQACSSRILWILYNTSERLGIKIVSGLL